MNRRFFLKSLALAPVTAPVIAQQAAPAFASGGYVQGISGWYSFVGADWASVPCLIYGWPEPSPPDGIDIVNLSKSFDVVPQTMQRIEARLGGLGNAIAKVVDLAAQIPSDIEAQMDADDLFDSNTQVNALADQRAVISPEPKQKDPQAH